ncbi:MAG: hypothetical protein NC180_07650 [Muribaculaceae bacterium]|nr:hypothetical protein [Roseburia sp.]MCM1430149.1 hypothetical protein [Muribaculaceae bacterium]MCM1493080.1 hypothetical protein [Muribaculaceae bacterium]
MREQKSVHPKTAKLDEASALVKKEEERTERQKLSEMNRKQKLDYIFEYYGLTIAAVVLLVFAASFLLVHFLTNKETAFSVVAVNATEHSATVANEESHYASLLSSCGIDPESVRVNISSDIGVSPDPNDSASEGNVQTIQTWFMAGAVDAFFADEDFFYSLAEFDYFSDLSDYLPEEVLSAQEDNIVYAKSVETEAVYPAGVRLSADNAWLADSGWYADGAVLGIAEGAAHKDVAAAFILEVLEEK